MREQTLAGDGPLVITREIPATSGQESPTGRTRIEIRVVLVTTAGNQLRVAVEQGDNGALKLLGGDASLSESLDTEARRILRERLGGREPYMEQLYTVSVDERGEWLVVVAYLALIWFEGMPEPIAAEQWLSAHELPPLTAPDRMLIDYALVRLRAKIGYTTIAFHLLPPAFTLPELQLAYETILGQTLDKRNFRRRVLAAGFLEPTGDKRRDGSHRPAVVYRFRASHDREQYLTPAWANET